MSLVTWFLVAVATGIAWDVLKRVIKSYREDRARSQYQEGYSYVKDTLEKEGTGSAITARLWQEWEEGVCFAPSPFEDGMREALTTLTPSK